MGLAVPKAKVVVVLDVVARVGKNLFPDIVLNETQTGSG